MSESFALIPAVVPRTRPTANWNMSPVTTSAATDGYATKHMGAVADVASRFPSHTIKSSVQCGDFKHVLKMIPGDVSAQTGGKVPTEFSSVSAASPSSSVSAASPSSSVSAASPSSSVSAASPSSSVSAASPSSSVSAASPSSSVSAASPSPSSSAALPSASTASPSSFVSDASSSPSASAASPSATINVANTRFDLKKTHGLLKKENTVAQSAVLDSLSACMIAAQADENSPTNDTKSALVAAKLKNDIAYKALMDSNAKISAHARKMCDADLAKAIKNSMDPKACAFAPATGVGAAALVVAPAAPATGAPATGAGAAALVVAPAPAAPAPAAPAPAAPAAPATGAAALVVAPAAPATGVGAAALVVAPAPAPATGAAALVVAPALAPATGAAALVVAAPAPVGVYVGVPAHTAPAAPTVNSLLKILDLLSEEIKNWWKEIPESWKPWVAVIMLVIGIIIIRMI